MHRFSIILERVWLNKSLLKFHICEVSPDRNSLRCRETIGYHYIHFSVIK